VGNYQTARDGRRNDRVKRREFITLLGGVASWPIATRAQQPERMRRIGVLEPIAVDDPEALASHGLRAGAAAVGLDRQPQCADRLSLGGWRCRPHSPAGRGIGRARTRCNSDSCNSDCSAGAAGDPHRADRVRGGRRSGRRRLRGQSGAPWRQRHRLYQLRVQHGRVVNCAPVR